MDKNRKDKFMNEGYWAEIPEYPLDDWKAEVMNNDTRVGYHEWVKACVEADEAYAKASAKK